MTTTTYLRNHDSSHPCDVDSSNHHPRNTLARCIHPWCHMTYMSKTSTKTAQLWIKAKLQARIHTRTSIKPCKERGFDIVPVWWNPTWAFSTVANYTHVVQCNYSKQNYTMVGMAHWQRRRQVHWLLRKEVPTKKWQPIATAADIAPSCQPCFDEWCISWSHTLKCVSYRCYS